MIRVAIIDDHFIVRVGLKAIIDMESDIDFCGESDSAAHIVDFVDECKPDVLLLDIRMPDRDGIDALAELKRARPNQNVLMLTTSETDNDIFQAISLGAKGYLLKDRDSMSIIDAVRKVAAGGKFIPPAVRERYRELEAMEEITPAETKILELVVDGLSNDEIAKSLSISLSGVKFHISNLLSKLYVRDRSQLVATALLRGFVKRRVTLQPKEGHPPAQSGSPS